MYIYDHFYDIFINYCHTATQSLRLSYAVGRCAAFRLKSKSLLESFSNPKDITINEINAICGYIQSLFKSFNVFDFTRDNKILKKITKKTSLWSHFIIIFSMYLLIENIRVCN